MTRGFKVDYTSAMVWGMIKATITVCVLMGGWYVISGGGAIGQMILHLIGYTLCTSTVFVILKRDEIWYDGVFSKDEFYGYIFLSALLSSGSYFIGMLAVILSGVIGPVPTMVAFGMEGFFTAFYSYLDVKNQIDEYNEYKKREDAKNASGGDASERN